VPPPGPSGSGQPAGPGNPRQPEPPGSSGSSADNVGPASSEASPPTGAIGQAAGAAGKAQDTLGSVSTQMRNLGRRLNSVVPPDHAPHSTRREWILITTNKEEDMKLALKKNRIQ